MRLFSGYIRMLTGTTLNRCMLESACNMEIWSGVYQDGLSDPQSPSLVEWEVHRV